MKYMAITALILLAGCSSPSSSEDHDEDKRTYSDGYDAGYEAARIVYNPPKEVLANRDVRSTVDVDAGAWVAYNVSVAHDAELSYSITQYAGPLLDVYVMPSTAMADYEANGSWDWLDNCSDLAAGTVERSCRLPAGSWLVVLDNTARGPVLPDPDGEDETARLRFQYEVLSINEAI